MKFESLSKEEKVKFLEPDSAYEIELKKELYEYEWICYKITQTHKWDHLGSSMWLTCTKCKLQFKRNYEISFEPFYIKKIDFICYTDDEMMIKDIIE